MTKTEIYDLLQKAYDSQFLDSIELISEENKNYMKSEFYKKTRISLSDLYKNYFQYKRLRMGLSEQLEELVVEFNTDLAAEKLEELLIKLKDNTKVLEILEGVFENFDSSKLEEYSKKIQEVITDLKQ